MTCPSEPTRDSAARIDCGTASRTGPGRAHRLLALAEKHLFHYRYARAALIERALDAAERRRKES